MTADKQVQDDVKAFYNAMGKIKQSEPFLQIKQSEQNSILIEM